MSGCSVHENSSLLPAGWSSWQPKGQNHCSAVKRLAGTFGRGLPPDPVKCCWPPTPAGGAPRGAQVAAGQGDGGGRGEVGRAAPACCCRGVQAGQSAAPAAPACSGCSTIQTSGTPSVNFLPESLTPVCPRPPRSDPMVINGASLPESLLEALGMPPGGGAGFQIKLVRTGAPDRTAQRSARGRVAGGMFCARLAARQLPGQAGHRATEHTTLLWPMPGLCRPRPPRHRDQRH